MEKEEPVSRELMTVAEAAARLKVSRMTIYRMMKSERIKFLKLGDRRFFQKSDIEELVERQSDKAA